MPRMDPAVDVSGPCAVAEFVNAGTVAPVTPAIIRNSHVDLVSLIKMSLRIGPRFARQTRSICQTFFPHEAHGRIRKLLILLYLRNNLRCKACDRRPHCHVPFRLARYDVTPMQCAGGGIGASLFQVPLLLLELLLADLPARVALLEKIHRAVTWVSVP